VGLVVKAMNAYESSPNWQRLKAMVTGDPRIRVMNQTMTRAEVLALTAECDCYVSLHRAEGLGMGPMEAMLLGKPVILTNYSGVIDYALPEHALLVEYRLIPVEAGQYIFPEGQVWADPDVDQAARYMQALVADPESGRTIGAKAARFVADTHSVERCGSLYRERLAAMRVLED